ncbi:ABC transporter ATP-binding protein [Salibacterium aidingense]|uniref:ABC transporter ATP-binding protein n=1 Tax=Salibacterium aidingense TaxID=384933 RepID=UPI003BC064CE
MIKFENVRKEFGEHVALHNINFEVNEGELVCLIGPSGCGKTTCLKMVNRLIEITSGNIYIEDKNIYDHNEVELRRNVGYVIQQIGLFPHLSIEKNIALVPKLKGWEKEIYTQRIDELLDMVGLDPKIYKERFPSELSGGQQQRVGVIRALAAEPPIVLMDEPFSALDPISREQLQDEMVRLLREIKKTVLFVTHDMDEALKIADRIAIMLDGHIIQFDTPNKILKNPENAFVHDFIGEKRLAEAIDEQSLERKVCHVMEEPAVSLTMDSTIANARRKSEEIRTNVIPVFQDGKQWMGLIFTRDLYLAADDHEPVSSIMKQNVAVLHPDDHWKKALENLLGPSSQPLIPVVKENETVGIVTEKSILNCLTAKENIIS